MDRLSKAILMTVGMLLAITALRPFIIPTPTLAAGHFEYLVVSTDPSANSMQDVLNKYTAKGWELAAPVVSEQRPGVTFIFQKAAH